MGRPSAVYRISGDGKSDIGCFSLFLLHFKKMLLGVIFLCVVAAEALKRQITSAAHRH